MPLNDGKSEIHLPPRKQQVVDEIRGRSKANATRVPDLTGVQKSGPTRRLRNGSVGTIEISAREYDLLCRIAALAENFVPALEGVGMQVQQPKAFAMLSECTQQFAGMRRLTTSYADTHALLGMLQARAKLQR